MYGSISQPMPFVDFKYLYLYLYLYISIYIYIFSLLLQQLPFSRPNTIDLKFPISQKIKRKIGNIPKHPPIQSNYFLHTDRMFYCWHFEASRLCRNTETAENDKVSAGIGLLTGSTAMLLMLLGDPSS